ncbi:MAG TPA: hypothetical protein VGU23_08245, partial [Acidobacteriaceae bacterium]|nr:hypothetical protein [Acidobacteriaceae bacterium]
RNDVGLLAEEYDTGRRRMVGNFPQALSHITLVHAAFAMSGAWSPPQPVHRRKKDSSSEGASDRSNAKAAASATKARSKRS